MEHKGSVADKVSVLSYNGSERFQLRSGGIFDDEDGGRGKIKKLVAHRGKVLGRIIDVLKDLEAGDSAMESSEFEMLSHASSCDLCRWLEDATNISSTVHSMYTVRYISVSHCTLRVLLYTSLWPHV